MGSFYISFSSEGTLTAKDFNPVHHIKAVNVNWERGVEFFNLKESAEFRLVSIRSVQKKVMKALKNGDTTVDLVDDPEDLPDDPDNPDGDEVTGEEP